MNKASDGRKFELRFEKNEAAEDSHEIPVIPLARVLDGIQHLVNLVAMAHTGCGANEREYIAREMARDFPVMCGKPGAGSYTQPISIGAGDGLSGHQDAVAGKFKQLLEAVSGGGKRDLKKVIADSGLRERIRKSFHDIASRARKEGYNLSVIDETTGKAVFNSNDARKNLKKRFKSLRTYTQEGVVTGYLEKITLKEQVLTLRHAKTNLELTCSYQEDMEAILFANPRKLIQLEGMVRFNHKGDAMAIWDVTKIFEINLEPVVLDKVKLVENQGYIVPHEPISLTPKLTKSRQYYEMAQECLHVSIMAHTRPELARDLEDEYAFLWRAYAKEDDARLAKRAREIKQQMLQMFTEQK